MIARAHFGVAKLAYVTALDTAAQLHGHRLHAVADSQYRHALRPDRGGRPRRVSLGDAVRSTREDDALRVERPNEFVVDVVRMDFAIDVELAQTPPDQLRVLRAEVDDQNPAMLDVA